MKLESQVDGLRVAVASYDASWLHVVACYFSEYEGVGYGDYFGRGKQLLNALEDGLDVQIVVLDEQLQDMDLLSFMEAYAVLTIEPKPVLIGLGNKRYLGYVGNLFSLGLDDFIAKPFQMETLARRCMKLYQERAGGRVKTFCEQLYQLWGVAPGEHLTYLTDAVKIASETSEKLALRKEIVWCVAELHECSHNAVDSSLRRLIHRLEEKKTPGYLAFKEENGLADKKLQVGQLVFTIKHQLELQSLAERENKKEAMV